MHTAVSLNTHNSDSNVGNNKTALSTSRAMFEHKKITTWRNQV